MTYMGIRRRAGMLALIAVMTLLAACGDGSTASSRATPTVIRNATSTPIPTVLYEANWSQGADGWTLPAGWSIQDGALVNDGSGVEPLPVPYTVTAPDYEVDIVARVVNVASPQNCGNLYGMQANDLNGNELYYAQIYCIGTHPQNPGESLLYVDGFNGNPLEATFDFALNNDVKTYRIQVHGKGIRFFPNSAASIHGLDAPALLSPASFNLKDWHVQLVITRFAVLKLNAIR